MSEPLVTNRAHDKATILLMISSLRNIIRRAKTSAVGVRIVNSVSDVPLTAVAAAQAGIQDAECCELRRTIS